MKEGREEEEEDLAATGWLYGNERTLKIEFGSTGSYSVENPFWRRLWTCRQTEYWMYEMKYKQADILRLVTETFQILIHY